MQGVGVESFTRQEKCLEAGANEYISKPVRLKTLVEMIKDLLEIQKPE